MYAVIPRYLYGVVVYWKADLLRKVGISGARLDCTEFARRIRLSAPQSRSPGIFSNQVSLLCRHSSLIEQVLHTTAHTTRDAESIQVIQKYQMTKPLVERARYVAHDKDNVETCTGSGSLEYATEWFGMNTYVNTKKNVGKIVFTRPVLIVSDQRRSGHPGKDRLARTETASCVLARPYRPWPCPAGLFRAAGLFGPDQYRPDGPG